jgi:RNA polymerase sigma factor (sigma-70 family)
MPAGESSTRKGGPPSGYSVYFAELWSFPLLTADQERHCFRKLNYLKHLAEQERLEALRCRGHTDNVRRYIRYRRQCDEARNRIAESNLRLVVSIAKRYCGTGVAGIEELISVGNEAVLRAVDLFDFRRGTRFSTYAYRAIQRSIRASLQREARKQCRLIADSDDVTSRAVGDAGASDRAELQAREVRQTVMKLLSRLGPRDQQIVMSRFGIDREGDGVSFRVIAGDLGLSNTRITQLFHRSIDLMRRNACQPDRVMPESSNKRNA